MMGILDEWRAAQNNRCRAHPHCYSAPLVGERFCAKHKSKLAAVGDGVSSDFRAAMFGGQETR